MGTVRAVNVELNASAARLKGELQGAVAALNNVGTAAAKAGENVTAAMEKTVPPIQESAAATIEFGAAIDRLIVAIREENSQLSLSIQRNLAHTASLRQTGQAAHGATTEIQAVSGALRVLEGNGGIRVAERFLTSIPGIGAAAQSSAAIFGIVAVGDAIAHIFEKIDPLTNAEKRLAEATKQTDDEFARLGRDIEQISIQRVTNELGKLQGLNFKNFFASLDVSEAQARIASLDGQIRRVTQDTQAWAALSAVVDTFAPGLASLTTGRGVAAGQLDASELIKKRENLNQLIKKLNDQQQLDNESLAKDQAQEAGQLSADRISNQIAALNREAQAKKSAAEASIALARETAQAEIDLMHDPEARAVAAAQQDVATAKARAAQITAIETNLTARISALIRQRGGAESQGKTPAEQALVQTKTTGDVAAAQGSGAETIASATNAVALAQAKLAASSATATREYTARWTDAVDRGFDEIAKGWQEATNRASEYTERIIAAQARVNEIVAKSTGEIASLKLVGDKLQAEREYASVFDHTSAQQIAQAQKLADIDSSARQAKIAGLTDELSKVPDTEDPANIERRATLEAQIAEQKKLAANADYEAQTKILAINQQIQLSALAAGGAPQQRIRSIQDELNALNQIKVTDQNIVDIELARKALNDQLLETVVQQKLALGGLKDGWDAFWISMQESAEKPGKILFDTMHSAIDQISADLGKLITDPKHNNAGKLFGDTLKSIGQETVTNSIRSTLQTGLGSLGKTLGINISGLSGKPGAKQDGQTPETAIYVQVADIHEALSKLPGPGGVGWGSGRPIVSDPGGSNPWGSIFGGAVGNGPIFNFSQQGQQQKPSTGDILGGFFGSLLKGFLGGGAGGFGGGSGGGGESVTSSISYGGAFATGGDIYPGSAYLVGERGPEMVVPKSSGTVIPNDQFGGVHHHYNVNVDARGLSAVDEQRIYQNVYRGINAASKTTVSTSVQANVEQSKRTPGGK